MLTVCWSRREYTRREDGYTAEDCSRTVGFDRGRQALDIVLDLGGSGWEEGGGEGRKEGVFLYCSATGLAEPPFVFL